MFEEEVKDREEALLIDWTKHRYGVHETNLKAKEVARDFNERLKEGLVNDLDDYFEYLGSLDSGLFVEILLYKS